MSWIIGFIVIFLGFAFYGHILEQKEKEKVALMPPDEQQKYLEEKQARMAEARLKSEEITYGAINPEMTCQHCQTKGKIRTKHVTQKKGVSGGKATAAVFTGGLSLLAVGLSRKEGATQAYCGNCKNTWFF